MPSIEPRSNGSYRITVSSGYDSKGKKIRNYKTITQKELSGMTEKQIGKYLDKQAILFENAIQNGTYLDGEKITLAEFIEKWLADYAEKQLAPGTLQSYKPRIEKRIIPALGHMKLAKIQPHHLLEFYNNIAEDGIRLDAFYKPTSQCMEFIANAKSKDTGISPKTMIRLRNGENTNYETAVKVAAYFKQDMKVLFTTEGKAKALSSKTVKHHHDLLSSILGTAVQWNVILSNPAARVSPPKVEEKPKKFYDDEQVIELFRLLENEPLKYKAAIYLAVDTGIRESELAGLEWSDVDYENQRIDITEQRQYVHGYGIAVKPPKTKSGIRFVTVSEPVIDLLKQYQQEQDEYKVALGDRWIDSGYIFVHEDGEPMHPHRPYKWFMEFLKKHDLPKIDFHSLRHTNASLLISEDTDLVTVSGRLGHSDKNVTLRTYSHMIRSKEKQAPNALKGIYSRINKSN